MKRPSMLILLITLLVLSCIKKQRPERIQPGDPLPEFSTYTLSGANVSMTDLIEKPGYVPAVLVGGETGRQNGSATYGWLLTRNELGPESFDIVNGSFYTA